MNHHPRLLQNLYVTASNKYRKFKFRFDKAIQNGRFYKFNRKKQSSLVHRLKKLFERLKSLQAQLRIAGACTALALLLAVGQAKGQETLGPYEKQDRANNPLREPIDIYRPNMAFVDLDNDSDLDMIAIEDNSSGSIRCFENAGPGLDGKPLYVEKTDLDNPFQSILPGGNSHIAFADIDDDNDPDLFIGNLFVTQVRFFRNNSGVFTEQTGNWNPTTKAGNPFDEISLSSGNGCIPFFVDFDGDGDKDVFMGTTNAGTGNGLKYIENQGSGVFDQVITSSHIFVTNPPISETASTDTIIPTLADIDGDADLDLVVGGASFSFWSIIQLFLNDSGSFNETGNPFYDTDTFNSTPFPVLTDVDGDEKPDLVVGRDNLTISTLKGNTIDYYENQGDLIFEDKYFLENPFDGVRSITLGGWANPAFIDIDNDSDLDAIIGGKYFGGQSEGVLWYYESTENGYALVTESPFDIDFPNGTDNLKPTVIDVDRDEFNDMVVCSRNGVFYLHNNGDGSFSSLTGQDNPFDFIGGSGNTASLGFIDVDNDGDLDLLLGDYDQVTLYRNNGTDQTPDYEEDTGFNEFANAYSITIIDLDSDGFDDVITTDNNYGSIAVFKNNGDETFTELPAAQNPFDQAQIGYGWNPTFIDNDGDGDMDLFISNSGMGGAVINFLKNENPSPLTTLNSSTLNTTGGTPAAVDPLLTLSDADGDEIMRAIISIEDFQQGDETLTFTPQAGITGNFDTDNGILTFTGRATISAYQTLLRTVSHNFTGTVPGGRKGRLQAIDRTINFQVFDVDLTNPAIFTRTIHVISSTNSAPLIEPDVVNVMSGSQVTFNIIPMITDSDGNFTPSPSTLTISQQPSSGATASLNFISTSVVELTVDYTGLTFQGTDQLELEACDDLGACATNMISIEVGFSTDIEIFNAISPNPGDAQNAFFRINGIEAYDTRKVTIFNRWGDIVFEMSGYTNADESKRFNGVSDDGKELPTGTYFYKIEITGSTLTGYLSLKR